MTNFGIEWNILSWNERRNNDGSKSEDSELCPHKPTFMVVKRFKNEGAKWIDIPITVDEPSAEQNPDEVCVRNICDFWWCRYGNQSQDR